MGQDVDAPTPEQGMQILEREVTGPMYRPQGRDNSVHLSVNFSATLHPMSHLEACPSKLERLCWEAWEVKPEANLARGLLGRRLSDSPAAHSACSVRSVQPCWQRGHAPHRL